MNRPKMILFDYGGTLQFEPEFNGLRGTQAMMEYIDHNPLGLTAQQVENFGSDIYNRFNVPAYGLDIELHMNQFNRLMHETLQISFALPPLELERVYWDAAAPAINAPNVAEMLDYLRDSGIRTGVISNIGFTGGALGERLARFFPRANFEFVIASSEYIVRKPNPLIFRLALSKANLPAGDVWYCGNSVHYDVEGAAGAGIFPVWYDNAAISDPDNLMPSNPPACEHLCIHDWLELVYILKPLGS